MQFDEVCSQVTVWKQQGQKVVLATGVFDILHIEHFRFLQLAKRAGDRLIVGLETDQRVKQIKGPTRPVQNQAVRLEQISLLKPVDRAFMLPEAFANQTDWEAFMDRLRPDIYAVSSHTEWLENKQAITEKYDGTLQVVHQFNPAVSTSSIYEKLQAEM